MKASRASLLVTLAPLGCNLAYSFAAEEPKPPRREEAQALTQFFSATRVPWPELKVTKASAPFLYPILAQLGRISGEVAVRFDVDPKGQVIFAQALDGPPILRRTAELFLRGFRFQPILVDGKAVKIQSEVRVPFRPVWEDVDSVPRPLTGYVLHLKTSALGGAPRLEVGTLEKPVREWLAQMDLRPIEGTPADPLTTLDLSLEVKTREAAPDVFLQETRIRISNWADRDRLWSPTGSAGRTWTILKAAGQRGPDGYLTSFQRILAEFANDLGKADSRKSEPGPGIPEGGRQPVSFDFSQMKIHFQPPAPYYPAAAKEKRVQGTVVVEVTVGPKGVPIDAMAVSGPEPLVETAIAYALTWRFEPAMLDGVPQTARFKLTMPFRLR